MASITVEQLPVTAKMSVSSVGRYEVREASTRQELDQIMDVIWAANHTPYEPAFQLFFPVLGYTAAHRQAAIDESKERFWNYHQSDPASHWYYAWDTTTGKTIASAQWVISKTNPFADGAPKLQAPWWPEGDSRAFCESIINQIYKPRASWMARPHCALNWLAVHPSHRNRGVATLLMDIGIKQADDLNLECWLEASPMGKTLYEKYAYQSLFKLAWDSDRPNASDEWRRCASELTPEPFFVMWRPKQGQWKAQNGEGVKLPWDLGTA